MFWDASRHQDEAKSDPSWVDLGLMLETFSEEVNMQNMNIDSFQLRRLADGLEANKHIVALNLGECEKNIDMVSWNYFVQKLK